MKRILTVLILVFFAFHCEAQKKTDSLFAVLKTAKEDTNKVNTLYALGWELKFNNPDTAIILGNTALHIAEQLTLNGTRGWQKGIAKSYHLLGVCYWIKGSYPDALKNHFMALKIREQTNDKKGIAASLGSIGIVYEEQADYSKALDYYFKGLKMNEELGDKKGIAVDLGNIGNVNSDQADYSKALDYYLKALKMDEELGDKQAIAINLVNIGIVYKHQADYSKALDYYFKALKMNEGLGNKNGIAADLGNIGSVYKDQADYSKALDYYFKALKMKEELGNKNGIAINLGNIGEVYVKTGKFKEAEEYLKRSLAIADSIKALEITKEFEQSLSRLYDTTGRPQLALVHYKKYIAARDSIANDEITKKQTRTEMNYEFDKKEALTKVETEKELQKQKLIRNGFIGGFAIVLLFAMVFFSQRNKIKKGKKRSDELLLNILPSEVAEELKQNGHAEAKEIVEASVMFTDFKDFTKISENMTPSELVKEIDYCFSAFDNIIHKYGIEKIKTIGDAYMCAGGLPVANKTHAEDTVKAALEIRDFMANHNKEKVAKGELPFEIRIGINTGPVVAGIVGVKKFAYDIWGDTVNLASRMESSGKEGEVNISGSTYELIKDKFTCSHRGKIMTKNKGEVDMYFVS